VVVWEVSSLGFQEFASTALGHFFRLLDAP
jgi:hypothetical protein